MSRKNIRKTRYEIRNTAHPGTALLMTILILNSIIIISLAAAQLIISGVKDSGTQIKSTKAFFAAEAGAEKILYEYRKHYAIYNCGNSAFPTSSCSFTKNLTGGGSYQVYWKNGNNNVGSTLVFISVGTYSGLERTDELDFYY